MTRQVDYLRQALGHDKRPLGFLIAAGCPAAIKIGTDGGPLIPGIGGLTTLVAASVTSSKSSDHYKRVLENLNADGTANPDIETILSHIRSLRQIAGADIVRGLTAANLDDLEQKVSAAIVEVTTKDLPATQTPFHKFAGWIASVQRVHPVEIFTTNYDLLMEQALETHRVPYFDGFVGTRRPFFDLTAIEEDRLPARWTRLWKIHGSINWGLDQNGTIYRSQAVPDEERRLIHPSHLKYDESRRMPYFAMLDQLSKFIRQPASVLVTCGYSFRDNHLNATIVDALRANPAAVTFALFRGDLKKYGAAISVAMSCSNVSILASNGGYVGRQSDVWLPRDHGDPSQTDLSAILWAPVDTKKPDGSFHPTLKLGDFVNFGALLEDLSGMMSQSAT